jgi:hypothetical protein
LTGERITASAGLGRPRLGDPGRDRPADLRDRESDHRGGDHQEPDEHEELPARVDVQAVEREVEGHQPREDDHDQQDHLDDESEHAVDQPDRQGLGGRRTLPLEEADVHGDPGGRARHRQRDELDRVLERDHRTEPHGQGRGSQRAERLCHRNERDEQQARPQPCGVGLLELVHDLVEADVRDGREDEVRGEQQQRDRQQRADRDASERLELRRLRPRRGRGSVPDRVQVVARLLE